MIRRLRDGDRGRRAVTTLGVACLLILSAWLIFTAGRSSATASEQVYLEAVTDVGASPFLPPPANAADPELTRFITDCEAGVSNWRNGSISYPKLLTVDLDESAAYTVAVDIRSAPLPEERLIAGPRTGSQPISVQCTVAARLTPVGDALEVDDEDWAYREFTPSGIVNWTWSVTATRPSEPMLLLALQPVVTAGGGSLLIGGRPNTTATFVSEVDVRASWVERLGQWWTDNWETFGLIAAGLGVAMTAVVRWGGDFGQAVREAGAKWRRRPADALRPADPDEAPVEKVRSGT